MSESMSLWNSQVLCVVDVVGKIVAEAKVESHPAAIINFLRKLGLSIERIGLEAGPLSQWLHAGLTKGGFETVLLETRHVKAALSAMARSRRIVATRVASRSFSGWVGSVRSIANTPGSQEVRGIADAVARKQLLGKLLDVEFGIRGRCARLRVEDGRSDALRVLRRACGMCAPGQAMLEQSAEAMLAARAALRKEYSKLHKAMLALMQRDEICRGLMSAPGVGPLVAITFKTAIDDPARIRKSEAIGDLVGVDAEECQSRGDGRDGSVSCVGDEMARPRLYEAANAVLSRVTRSRR